MSKENERDHMSLPLFKRPFSIRVREGWESFAKGEAKLRELVASFSFGIFSKPCAGGSAFTLEYFRRAAVTGEGTE